MFGPNLRYALYYARARIYQLLSVVVIIDFLVSNFFQVLEARDTLPVNMRNPLLVKIAPDLSEDDKEDIAAVVSRNKVCSLISLFFLNASQSWLINALFNLLWKHSSPTG